MAMLSISHLTRYRYSQPAAFGEHRIMMRPRESFDQRLVEATLEITPEPSSLRYVHDVFGNSLAIAQFEKRAKELSVLSVVHLDHTPLHRNEIEMEDYARQYPFTYSSEDMPDLLRSIERNHHDPARVVDKWAAGFMKRGGATDTVAMLSEMAGNIRREFTYVPRHAKGTQTPMETLALRQGTCRDFAVLMIEAVRALGFAARFVSGYVYNPTPQEGRIGGGNTHAWVRVFLPGSGWVEFDPTNGIIGNRGLVRVAIARDPYQAIPLSGSWSGFPGSYKGMDIKIDICADATPPLSSGEPSGITVENGRLASKRKDIAC